MDLVYPRKCPVCNLALPYHKSLIHHNCYLDLPYVTGNICQKCGRPIIDGEEEYCNSCQNTKHYYTKGLCLYVRNEITRNMIYRLKYQGQREIADFLGYDLVDKLGKIMFKWKPDAIIPVPIHSSRLKERGFNQSIDISKSFQKYFYSKYKIVIPIYPNYVIRKNKTTKQKDLNANIRRQNMLGALSIGTRPRYIPNKVLIIDDIYTTGATIDAVSQVLIKDGIESVYFLAITCAPMI